MLHASFFPKKEEKSLLCGLKNEKEKGYGVLKCNNSTLQLVL